MAKTLTIGLQGGTPLDLLTGFKLEEGGFSYQGGDGRIWDTFNLFYEGTDSIFRTAMIKLDAFQYAAREFDADELVKTPVILIWGSEGETTKQALVYDLAYEVIAESFVTAMLGKGVAKVRLAVLHSSGWEDTASVELGSNSLSTLGGTVDLSIQTGGTGGTLPGRISELFVNTVASVVTLEKFWIGIRKLREGVSGFLSLWEAEDGTNGTDAADTADATASDGNKVTIDFATSVSLIKRISLRWNQVGGSNLEDIIGKYLLLARVKLSASTVEVAIDMRHGWSAFSGQESSLGVTYLSAVTDGNLTGWNLIPLGEVNIPPTGNRGDFAGAAADHIGSYQLSLYAERLSVSGSLDVDCFVLIPTDALLVVDGANVDAANGGALYAITGIDGSQFAVGKQITPTGPLGNVEFSFENWSYPQGGGLLVVAAQENGVHTLSKTINVWLDFYKRYRGYR